MKHAVKALLLLILGSTSFFCAGQPIARGFEVRYFTRDTSANGETDFRGETSTLSTEQRIGFLKYYADQASGFYNDPGLNTEVVSDKEAAGFYKSVRQQPLPTVRKRVVLDNWRWLGSKTGDHEASIHNIDRYTGTPGIKVSGGIMNFNSKSSWKWDFPVQDWRFSLEWRIKVSEKAEAAFILSGRASGKSFTGITVKEGRCFLDGEKAVSCQVVPGKWTLFRIEGDLEETGGKQHYNIYVDGNLVCDYTGAAEKVASVNSFEVTTTGGLEMDDLYGSGYHKTTEVMYPYYPKTFIDENFNIKPSVEGWQGNSYDDREWQVTGLPFAYGSERHEREDLYLRKTVSIDGFKRAWLNIETLDPGGEVWINGQMVSLVHDRYPVKLDITRYLVPFSENTIALKVFHFYLNAAEGVKYPCSYLDPNAGWFAGRSYIDLVNDTHLADAFVSTGSLGENSAGMHARLTVEHKGTLSFTGRIRIKMGLWQDGSAEPVTVVEKKLVAAPGMNRLNIDYTINNPRLWSPESPSLYKAIIEIIDSRENIVDDYVITTGIRTVSQEGGTFRLNGKPAMLNGTQIMGFRSPIENMITWLRCPPDYWVAKEMLMVKRMNCNMLRIHVHGWKEKAVGINDERYCELADQMGIMLIWATPAWIREGDWGQIDFEGYHKYMAQVQNHPSIVMWEISNHPNTFKSHDPIESNMFCEKAYQAVYPYDQSRLISFTSHIGHLHYGNDAGTIDQGGKSLASYRPSSDAGNQDALTDYGVRNDFSGNRLSSADAWTAPMVTRGNQDAPTGYGAQWTQLRKWPGAYRQDFLDSKERAYFDFEHQESIGQPNWSLCKGKPWYQLQSYEWGYDEGSIGRKLQQDEWRESQAWQAFSAYEAVKKLRILDYDGFSWCSLHEGGNAATYKKPAIDYLGHAKLVFHIHKTVFNPVLPGSDNVDVVYGPGDAINPVIINLGDEKVVNLTVTVRDRFGGKRIDEKVYRDVKLPAGRTVTRPEPFAPDFRKEGMYFIEYSIDTASK